MCMLNALFGNPNIQLVQLHPAFSELNNLDQAMRIFGSNSDDKMSGFVDSESFANSKKRRNAVTEVIRFICQNEFRPAEGQLLGINLDDIYNKGLEHMLNGNVKAAVKLMNTHNKFKMGLFMSTSVNNVSTRENLKA